MQRNHLFIALLIVLALIAAAVLVYEKRAEAPAMVSDTPQEEMQEFRYGDADIRFTHSSFYHLEKRDAGTPARPQPSVVLVEDTQENRDLLDGVVTEPREGPIAITIDVYQNPQNLSAEAWAMQDTNWNISTKQTEPVTVGGSAGVSYLWDGLYQGKSVIIPHSGRTYVFSVTWMSENDRILKDFDALLASVQFD